MSNENDYDKEKCAGHDIGIDTVFAASGQPDLSGTRETI